MQSRWSTLAILCVLTCLLVPWIGSGRALAAAETRVGAFNLLPAHHVSNDNPYSEAQFKTLKYCPAFPDRFGGIEHSRSFCHPFFTYYNTERGGGSLESLRSFLVTHGGRVAIAGQETTAAGLRTQAAGIGSVLGVADSRIAASAIREGAPIVTNDVRFANSLRAAGIPMASLRIGVRNVVTTTRGTSTFTSRATE